MFLDGEMGSEDAGFSHKYEELLLAEDEMLVGDEEI